jgi:hypothetical protein
MELPQLKAVSDQPHLTKYFSMVLPALTTEDRYLDPRAAIKAIGKYFNYSFNALVFIQHHIEIETNPAPFFKILHEEITRYYFTYFNSNQKINFFSHKDFFKSLVKQHSREILFMQQNFTEMVFTLKKSKPEFVIIDCVNSFMFTSAQYVFLVREFPKTRYIFICREANQKSFRMMPPKSLTDVIINVSVSGRIKCRLNPKSTKVIINQNNQIK